MPPRVDVIRTYFQNLISEDELSLLLKSGNSFVLENVVDMAGTLKLCEEKLALQGLTCRIEENRTSWTEDGLHLVPGPVSLIIAAWKLVKLLLLRQRDSRARVVIVKNPNALHFQFRVVG